MCTLVRGGHARARSALRPPAPARLRPQTVRAGRGPSLTSISLYIYSRNRYSLYGFTSTHCYRMMTTLCVWWSVIRAPRTAHPPARRVREQIADRHGTRRDVEETRRSSLTRSSSGSPSPTARRLCLALRRPVRHVDLAWQHLYQVINRFQHIKLSISVAVPPLEWLRRTRAGRRLHLALLGVARLLPAPLPARARDRRAGAAAAVRSRQAHRPHRRLGGERRTTGVRRGAAVALRARFDRHTAELTLTLTPTPTLSAAGSLRSAQGRVRSRRPHAVGRVI